PRPGIDLAGLCSGVLGGLQPLPHLLQAVPGRAEREGDRLERRAVRVVGFLEVLAKLPQPRHARADVLRGVPLLPLDVRPQEAGGGFRRGEKLLEWLHRGSPLFRPIDSLLQNPRPISATFAVRYAASVACRPGAATAAFGVPSRSLAAPPQAS